jgi:glycosyltransferase involved in cell wall biosynthesis
MRIVHVSDCYAPRTGGIESQVRDLARGQAAAGHEVHVVTATPGESGERGGVVQDDDGVQVHRFGTRMPFDLPINPAAPPRIRALLRDLRPDVVHVHAGVLSPFAYDGARVALGEAVPLAITWHCMLDGVVPVLRAAVRRSRWRRAPVALSAVSRVAADRVVAVFGAPVGVLPNGLDLELWRPGEPAPSGVLRCVATMRLAPRKRGLALIGIIEDATIQLEPGELSLDLIGDGPAWRRIQRRVARRGLGDVVTVRGRLDKAQIRATYAHADVFVAPAVLEAFGIAALEARAAGLAVVARRGTGIEEFVTDGVDGLLVDDDAGMARALVRLATHPGLVASLTGHARAHRPTHGWRVTLEAAEAEYRRARSIRV